MLTAIPQLFVGTANKVYFVDKVENNPVTINGHPAWASGANANRISRLFAECSTLEWTLGANSQRAMDAVTNAFCAVSFATYHSRCR